MSDDEMRVAIAEWLGWRVETSPREGRDGMLGILRKPDGHIASTWHGNGIKTLQHYFDTYPVQNCLPNYPADLNAMHEAELIIACGRFREYTEALEKAVAHQNAKEDELRYDLLHATARQRAEALLRTLGRWRD